ncbi:hypothetical protein KY348_01710 [Candidatus Woesearchaeota archaeon]|nr:hypothetical protein [Candidatus Woesearchaeota archaeon]
MFRDNAIFLLVISAILIPLIFITTELFLLGVFILLFILSQVVLIYLFYKETEAGFEEWYAFWSAILSLVFMLVLVLIGRRVVTEFLGLILFLIYFIGLIIFLFRKEIKQAVKKPRKKPSEEEDYRAFREKDELKELVEFFEAEQKPGVEVVDIEEPKIEKIVVEEADKEKKPREKQEQLSEEWFMDIPVSRIYDFEEKKIEQKPLIRELKEAPKVDFAKVKKDLQKIDDGVRTISEKIKLISEKAILEGAEKKIRQAQKKKKPQKPKKKEMKVYASKTGTKYHFDKNCLGLKRVSKKNFMTYANSAEARKKKLKGCEICK